MDTTLTYKGMRVLLSGHAYERLIERVFGQTTRNVTTEIPRLMKSARFSVKRPALIPPTGRPSAGQNACWLLLDDAGVQFALPLEVTTHQAYPGRVLIATTCLMPGYKTRKPSKAKSGRKQPKRKPQGRGRSDSDAARREDWRA